MDRIDINGANGIASRLRARSAAPVAQADQAKAVGADPDQSGATALAALGRAGSEAPVDQTRVREIRTAIRQGHYPLDPHKTADAMIASGFMLRNER